MRLLPPQLLVDRSRGTPRLAMLDLPSTQPSAAQRHPPRAVMELHRILPPSGSFSRCRSRWLSPLKHSVPLLHHRSALCQCKRLYRRPQVVTGVPVRESTGRLGPIGYGKPLR
jgi:hypothetical protein